MGRHCCFPSCKNTSGLHSFPVDLGIRRQWLRALGLLDRNLPPRAGVCNHHFSQDCFSNLMEVNMGFTKLLMLKSDAVPNVAVPVVTRRPPSQQLHLQNLKTYLLLQPKKTREIGCQTEPVSTKHAAGQADIKPNRRSKAIQTRNLNRSVSCNTDTFMASMGVPEDLEILKAPSASSTPVKRTSATNVLLPPTATKYIVHECKLMELFKKCPVCTRSCIISKTVVGTVLQVKQSCAHCEYFHQWSSQPLVNNIPEGKQLLKDCI